MSAPAAPKKRRLPIGEGIVPIDRKRLPMDVAAGVTLAALGIPEVMGYAKIAGMPVVTGLYTIVLPIAVFALFSSSRHLVVGADSATAAILAAGLAGMAPVASPQYVELAGMLALITGGVLILARLIRLGFLADFLSRSVLIGFLTGVGVQVALGQVPTMLGITPSSGGTMRKFFDALGHLSETSVATVAVSLGVIVVILGAKRIDKRIPGALIAVIGAIFVSWNWDLVAHGVSQLGAVPSGLPSLGIPDVTWSECQKLFGTAGAIFIVILAQSAATARAYAAKYSENLDENVDLVGLGLANAAAGLSGTFVVNGSPTKTQMVDGAGGRSQLASLTTAVLVVIVLLFLTAPLQYMPNAALAAVVFLIGIELVDIAGLRLILSVRLSEFVVAGLTAIVVVVVGVEQGIILAVVLSLIDHLRRSYRPNDAVLTERESGVIVAAPLSTRAQAVPGLIVYRFITSLYYANANRFSQEIQDLTKDGDPPVEWICVEAAAIFDIDFTGAETLRELDKSLAEHNVRLVLAEPTDALRAQLAKWRHDPVLGTDDLYGSVADVLRAFAARPEAH